MSHPPIVELDRVGYRQQSTDILTDVSWRLGCGEHWAVLGPNGCGKTTLFRIACGYLWPTSGVVRRMGRELIDLAELRRSIGWVATELVSQIPPQERAVETVVSGRYAQVGLKAFAHLQPNNADFAEARRLLDEMNCSVLADKLFGILSQGERQQTLVARARMAGPMLVVLDEPCAGMDPGVRERFLAWLDGLAAAATDMALVLVTHHVEEIMPAFESTLAMRAGRIVAAGPTRDVLSVGLLEQLYDVGVESFACSAGRYWPTWRASHRAHHDGGNSA